MDLREKKTKRSIKQAFLQLREQKPLERITIKELAELAEISKATFYLHYKDIYDLSGQLETEVIQDVLRRIDHPADFLTDPSLFLTELVGAFQSCQQSIDVLFSGSRERVLPENLEQGLRQHICDIAPQLRDDADFQVLLTYQVQGGYYAYMKNRQRYRKNSSELIALLAGQSQGGYEAFLQSRQQDNKPDGLDCLQKEEPATGEM